MLKWPQENNIQFSLCLPLSALVTFLQTVREMGFATRTALSSASQAWKQMVANVAAASIRHPLLKPFSTRVADDWRWRPGNSAFRALPNSSSRNLIPSRPWLFPPSLSHSATAEPLYQNTIDSNSYQNLHGWLFKEYASHLAVRDEKEGNQLLRGRGLTLIASAKASYNGNYNSSTREAALAIQQCAGLLAFYADHHVVPLPPDHRFPMTKYRATRMLLEEDASLRNILVTCPAPQASEDELSLVHEKRYLDKTRTGNLDPQEERTVGFPWSPELVKRSNASSGGTIAAMHAVMLGVARAAANIAGGTHHAFSDHGEGFCVYNDIAVAAMVALRDYPGSCSVQSPILVIDLDVHQGNGTAKIFEDDDRVITFSMHGENNYPWRTKMKSNYDIDLPDGTEDVEYLSILSQWLPKLFEKHRPFLVFFQAGVDALQVDSFGRLSLTRDGLLRRNNAVYTACLERDLPLVITMGGGYSRPSDASIQAHADVYRSAALRFGSPKNFSKASS